MDIVAESLSANVLRAKDVTVRGQDVFEWFQSKLSAAVSFAGVFDDLSAAPKRNGAVAIVGSKDYIYSSDQGGWRELGDEGQIGTLRSLVNDVSSALSALAGKVPTSRTVNLKPLSSDVTLTADDIDYSTPGGSQSVQMTLEGIDANLASKAAASDLRYRIAQAEVGAEDGYILADRTINLVTLFSGTSETTLVFPARTPGYSRDFMVRLVIEGSDVPQISFVEPDGSDVAFDEDDDAWAGIG